jgi:hypothetical protein
MTGRCGVVAAGAWLLLALAAIAPRGSLAGDEGTRSFASAFTPDPRFADGVVPETGSKPLFLGAGETVLRRQPAPETPAVRTRLRRMRPNTISLGVQGQYGVLRGNSRLADGFDHGPGYAFRFRYMLSPTSALGFSFEHQRFGSIQPALNVSGAPEDSHAVITTVSAEGVFFMNRERELTPYLLGGFGFATPDIIFTEDQASRVNEGIFAVAGAGFERFVRPRFSVDVSLRGYALLSNSQFTSMAQASLGIHLYPGD